MRHCITIVIVVLWLRDVLCQSFMREEGPFEAHVYNISNCITEKPWFHINVTTYTRNGRRLLRGQIVTHRRLKNPKFSVQVHYVDEGRVKVFDLRNQNCHNMLVRLVLQSLHVPLNLQKCTMEPSTAEFSDLDINAIMHAVVPYLWYGTVVTRFEIAMPAASLICHEINLQIHKINGTKVVKTL